MEIELKFNDLLEHYSKALTALIRKIDNNEQLTSELISLTFYLPVPVTTSQRLYHFKYNIQHIVLCKTCQKELIYKSFTLGYRTYCNSTCANKDSKFLLNRKQSNLRTYGCENVSQLKDHKIKVSTTHQKKTQEEKQAVQNKRKRTALHVYGKEHHLRSEEIMNKQRQTNLTRYGMSNVMQSEKVKEAHKQTCLKNHGVVNVSQIEYVKNLNRYKQFEHLYTKLHISNRLKNLVKPLFTLEEYRGVDKRYLFQCIKCHTVFEDHINDGKIPRCFVCFPPIKGTSQYENELQEWFGSLQIQNIKSKDRQVISPLELDIYLPEYNLAIEFNGLFWHSELSGKDAQYHINKTNLCKEKNIQLIHIFEDEWIEKQEIVKSIIKNKLGITDRKIFGRKCEIREVNSKEASNFLFENHLQKPIISKYNYGLYIGNELVYLVCLSKSRYNKNYEYELLRSCCRINTQVLGGFDKLINHVLHTLQSKSIISYIDKRYFNGNGYKNWKYIGDTEPNYFYMKYYTQRESRLKYQKHKLVNQDTALTEWENMQLSGYDRIWDCGNMTFAIRE